MAIPPRMLPTATPRSPDQAAPAVIAISGRLVAIASRMTPPSASPSPKRTEITSVVLESWIPATQITAADAAKMATRATIGRWANTSAGLAAILVVVHRHRRPAHPFMIVGVDRGDRAARSVPGGLVAIALLDQAAGLRIELGIAAGACHRAAADPPVDSDDEAGDHRSAYAPFAEVARIILVAQFALDAAGRRRDPGSAAPASAAAAGAEAVPLPARAGAGPGDERRAG